MAKINATYSSGYYISPDMDYRALEDHKSMERKRERRMAKFESMSRRRKIEDREKKKKGQVEEEEEDVEDGEDSTLLTGNAIRQTFALPFDIYCGHCNKRMARGSHVYTNRRPTPKKYLGSMRIWSLEIRCKFCHGSWFLETDYETPKETGGYLCAKDCRRQEGDFATLNAKNREVREAWEAAELAKIETPLEAMERENEMARRLEEKNREVEELIQARAGQRDAEDGLLQSLRSEGVGNMPESGEQGTNGGGSKPNTGTGAELSALLPSSAPVTRSLNHLLRGFGIHSSAPSSSNVVSGETGHGQENENAVDNLPLDSNLFGESNNEQVQLTEQDAEAEEAAYQQFEAEMLIQQKRERLQQRKAAAEKTLLHSINSNIPAEEDDIENENSSDWKSSMTAEDKRLIQEAERRYAQRHTVVMQQLPAQGSTPFSLPPVSPSVMLFGSHTAISSDKSNMLSSLGSSTGNRFLLPVDDDDIDGGDSDA